MRFLHLFLLTFALWEAIPAAPARAADVTVFWREGCPHCERELEFLDALRARDPALEVRRVEISGSPANRRLLRATVERLQVRDVGVPLTVVGAEALVGWWDAQSTGAWITQRVRDCRSRGCPDVVGELAAVPGASEPLAARPGGLPATLRLPLLGEVDTRSLSLPVLTLVLAAVDGFNPCAMWTLVFLVGLLVGMQDRVRMWVLGTAFIVASAGVYFLFMAALLNVLLFLGALAWVRMAVGAVALGGGAWYLREFWVNRDGVCRVTGQDSRRRTLERLKALAYEKRFLLALGGIVALAFAVNLIELLCSAGIPAVFTQALSMSDLPRWQYLAYLLLYILVFMLDDLVVFFTAMITLQATGLSAGYARWSHLVGGLVLVAIGAMMWFRPAWLSP